MLELLKAQGALGATTFELQAWSGSMAPATDISELRQNGYRVACKCEGTNGNGRRVYRYKLEGKD